MPASAVRFAAIPSICVFISGVSYRRVDATIRENVAVSPEFEGMLVVFQAAICLSHACTAVTSLEDKAVLLAYLSIAVTRSKVANGFNEIPCHDGLGDDDMHADCGNGVQ